MKPAPTHPLRQYRAKNGVTLEQLAGLVGTTKANLSRIENGVHLASMGLAGRLSRTTGVPLEKFLPAEAAR
jgi:transcriptional regulator with XRE-family HTH domain